MTMLEVEGAGESMELVEREGEVVNRDPCSGGLACP